MSYDDAAKPHLIDGKYEIGDLVDMGELRDVFEKFTQATGFAVGFLDHPGLNILIATGWRDICAKFHRTCPVSAANCTKSNRHLLDRLKEPRDLVIEQCDNGLVDCAVPIFVKEKHIASLITGQVLLERPDIDRFRRQAEIFGFDVNEYLEALKDIPVVSEEKLRSVTVFFGEMAYFISKLGYSNLIAKQESLRLENEVAERKRAEETQFDSRQMLRSVLDNIPQRVFWKDRNLVVVGCNKPLALDCGYEEPSELVGKTGYETAAATIADLHRADDRKVMESGRAKINYEELQMRPDGSQAWHMVSKAPMYDRDGRVIGMLGTYADITERKLMEEQIRETNAYLENIFLDCPDAIAIVDMHGRFIRWNKMAEDLFGFTFEEMKGKPAFDLYADKDELKKMLVSLRREGSVKKWEMRMNRKDGRIVPLEISIGLLKDSQNETLGSVGVARDISGTREALAALKASNERLNQEISERKQAEETVERLRRDNELILNSSGEGILGFDKQGRHTFVNPAASRMLGYMADELIGRKGDNLYRHTRENGGRYSEEDCPIFHAFRDGRFCQVAEEVFWKKDGTSFPARYSSAPIIEDGEVLGAVVTFRDNTEYDAGCRWIKADLGKFYDWFVARNRPKSFTRNIAPSWKPWTRPPPAIVRSCCRKSRVGRTGRGCLTTSAACSPSTMKFARSSNRVAPTFSSPPGGAGPWLGRNCDLYEAERSWQVLITSHCDDCYSHMGLGYLGLPLSCGVNAAGLVTGGASMPCSRPRS